MNNVRQLVEDGSWFNLDKARKWDDKSDFGLGNALMLIELFLTEKGSWVIHASHRYAPSPPDIWRRISPTEAMTWFMRLNHAIPDEFADLAAKNEL